MDWDEDSAPAAGRLEAALQAYRAIIAGLVEREWKMENYRAAADLLLQMQGAARDLPQLHAEWLEVHISHFEFTHALWEVRGAAKEVGWLVTRHARHSVALERLQMRCAERNW